MKIADFQIRQQAMSQLIYREQKTTSLQVQLHVPEQTDNLTISEEGVRLLESDAENEFSIHYSEEDLRKIELLEKFVSHVLGRPFRFSFVSREEDERISELDKFKTYKGRGLHKGHGKERPRQDQANQSQVGPIAAFRITSSSYQEEFERMRFSSEGTVRTEDGAEIEFAVNLDFSRSYYEENSIELQVGEFHDPLVLNLDGSGIAFSDRKIELDLNMDGKLDEFRALTQGNGILVVDENENGLVDDGSEVVGAAVNDAFGALMEHDEDHNLWIDENDSIYEDLKLWVVDEAGESKLIGLSDAGVGALFLGSVDSQYHFKEGFEAYAMIKESSIYLKESGQAMMVHELDLKI